ncbi:1-aminocyclopropane-1-carboxylate deaminase/D-cysteine desulfhydrase [Niabella sp. 22666]|uniref:1-aminocyclopropane-1-carboxylate deaminase/D-cysteine desulfhydrase n=1 Tax=Niabella sp. 22666 TaxID=3453954 RepID=UPI003F8608E3
MDIIDEDLITTETVPFLSRNGINVHVLRLDKIHPVISGNKWFKLTFHLQKAIERQYKTIVTFGGAFSNHIAACAAACAIYNIPCVGIIRGEEPPAYSHTLLKAQQYGMQLHFISRSDYQNKTIPPSFLRNDYYIIPEGGYSQDGALGASTIPYDKSAFDYVLCAVGTGTMMAGLMNSKADHATVLGFSVLKNHLLLNQEVQNLLIHKDQAVPINHDYHFGGYAKQKPALLQFMNELFTATGIPTDFVYTGKLFYAVYDLINQNYFPIGSRLLLVHSGGLQGNLSLRKGTLIF